MASVEEGNQDSLPQGLRGKLKQNRHTNEKVPSGKQAGVEEQRQVPKSSEGWFSGAVRPRKKCVLSKRTKQQAETCRGNRLAYKQPYLRVVHLLQQVLLDYPVLFPSWSVNFKGIKQLTEVIEKERIGHSNMPLRNSYSEEKLNWTMKPYQIVFLWKNNSPSSNTFSTPTFL